MSVLIEGPTGSGKEVVARALHSASGRSGAFVAFNACAISDSMFEDALFGHVRGAFTGASSDAPGFLREARDGTVFLDEISGLALSSQVKLLRAIESGEFRPIGARSDVRSNARVVAATNEDVATLVGSLRFRSDLAHRLRAISIRVPSLAEHLDDVPALVRHFLDRAGFSGMLVSDRALEMLQCRAWPGNIRELKHVVERTAIFAGSQFDEDAFGRAVVAHGPSQSGDGLCPEAAELRDALSRNEWRKKLAAQDLGVHVATVYRRMKRLRVVDR